MFTRVTLLVVFFFSAWTQPVNAEEQRLKFTFMNEKPTYTQTIDRTAEFIFTVHNPTANVRNYTAQVAIYGHWMGENPPKPEWTSSWPKPEMLLHNCAGQADGTPACHVDWNGREIAPGTTHTMRISIRLDGRTPGTKFTARAALFRYESVGTTREDTSLTFDVTHPEQHLTTKWSPSVGNASETKMSLVITNSSSFPMRVKQTFLMRGILLTQPAQYETVFPDRQKLDFRNCTWVAFYRFGPLYCQIQAEFVAPPGNSEIQVTTRILNNGTGGFVFFSTTEEDTNFLTALTGGVRHVRETSYHYFPY